MYTMIAIAVVNTLSGFLASSIAAPKGRANNGLMAGLILGPIGLLIAMGYSWPELEIVKRLQPVRRVAPVQSRGGARISICRAICILMGIWACTIVGYMLFA